jgi:ADP-ribosylglycohydrolase
MNEQPQRAHEAVIGALVGDAASMGFHWLYDQPLIERHGGSTPEFHAPAKAEYEDKGYFAHEGKQAGEFSHYGAQLLALHDAILEGGEYLESNYIQSFRRWFDFGGQWVGYVDHPTRVSLLNLHQQKADEESIGACGADDTQNPALSKLPPLVAAHWQDPEAKATDQDIAKAIQTAESMHDYSSRQVAQKVGMHCGLDASFVVIVHLLLKATSYEQAMKENIFCGGDSCGRAIPAGAILAACFHGSDQGVPSSWIARASLPESTVQNRLV